MNKKVIIFIPSIEEGGVEKNLFVISNYLQEKNINIEILTCNNKKQAFKRADMKNKNKGGHAANALISLLDIINK